MHFNLSRWSLRQSTKAGEKGIKLPRSLASLINQLFAILP
jgi:hypothetical protein